MHVGLRKRLTTRHGYVTHALVLHGIEDGVQRHELAAAEGIGRVAVLTS